jgi:hypothetical protein
LNIEWLRLARSDRRLRALRFDTSNDIGISLQRSRVRSRCSLDLAVGAMRHG